MSKFEKFVKDEFINKPLMASEIIGAMSQPKRTILGYQGGSIAEGKIRQLQSQLVQSQKFVVNDKLIEHACEASMVKPSTLNTMITTAIPPFKNMFIEWNESHRVHYLSKMYDKHLPDYKGKIEKPTGYLDRIGYHIFNFDHPSGQSWYMYEMWCMIDGKWNQSPLASVVHNDEEWNSEISYEHFKRRENFSKELPNSIREKFMSDDDEFRENFMSDGLLKFNVDSIKTGQKIIGRPYILKYFPNYPKDYLDKNNQTHINANHWMQNLCSRFELCQSSSMHWLIPKDKFKQGWAEDEMARITKYHLDLIQGGDLRFLISVLSLLNYDLIIQEKQQPAENKLKHIRYGRRVPTNEYSLISIDLPKPKGKKVYEKIFTGHGTPKRWHMRRGHWRRYRDVRGNVTKRVWVDQCEAGNKSLGKKINDYNLQKAKGE
jgi:hypothetical protein